MKIRKGSRVRLKDIAELTNVSVATVSMILNHPETKRFSDDKKKEVLEVAQKMKYVPNNAARSLVSRSTHTLGLIVPDLENPFFSTLAKRIENIARAKGYTVLIMNTNEEYLNDIALIEMVFQRDVDGLLLATSASSYGHEEAILQALDRVDIPYVIIDRSLLGYGGSQVVFDNKYGEFLATQYIIEKGHRKIGHVSVKENSLNGYYRYLGYVEALEKHGIAFNPHLVTHGNFDFETGYKGMEILINEGVTAIVAANDLIAYGVMKKAHELGIKIPEQLSIIGYDNLSMNDMLDIGLTSVDQDIAHLGDEALAILFELIKDGNTHRRVVLKPFIVERESVAAL